MSLLLLPAGICTAMGSELPSISPSTQSTTDSKSLYPALLCSELPSHGTAMMELGSSLCPSVLRGAKGLLLAFLKATAYSHTAGHEGSLPHTLFPSWSVQANSEESLGTALLIEHMERFHCFTWIKHSVLLGLIVFFFFLFFPREYKPFCISKSFSKQSSLCLLI